MGDADDTTRIIDETIDAFGAVFEGGGGVPPSVSSGPKPESTAGMESLPPSSWWMPAPMLWWWRNRRPAPCRIAPGTAWCESMQFAIALACRYLRLTPAQAIAAATINAAAAIDLADQIGSLESGKQADLLVLNTPSYQHLGYRFGTNLVDTVIKKGEVVYQSHA